MNRTYLGEFEEIVLLTVAVMYGQAYGVVLMHEIAEQTGRSVKLNQVHSALQRLEEKGMVKSEVGGATSERGGRRKRLYTVTTHGERTLQQIKEVRESFWAKLANSFKPAIGL
ncbi:Transcriptional regulator PadR-like family protein [Dyadobacter sp. SG02]|uniref:PadR family transcriptional regulator n=1 Tax=Dyadobacter sp. SG02 TaxID=1855291 RepID=UPI0008D3C951|nr:helix-turn-helix transcriptional regulator [Dyadobacter sp. SG02]SEI53632.1 Transcriptional regulator PadR-like family protein [Dyadobacter sp. SG02]